MTNKNEEIVTGLDLGTSTTCAVIGEVGEDGNVNVIGVGESPSNGLHKGVVVNIESTVSAVASAVAEAERMAGVKVGRLYAGVGGIHIKGFGSRGVVVVSQKHQEITVEDRDRVIEASRAKVLPADQEILHVIPRGYLVDDQDGIRDPVGMSGVRLECDVHLVTGSVTAIQNVVRSVEKAGYQIAEMVLNSLATAEVVLAKDEKELGVALLDIGGGTTDLVIYTESALCHNGVTPVGGNQVTSDLAMGLRTPNAEAEELKLRYAHAVTTAVSEDEEVHVAGIGGRPSRTLKRRLVAEIVEPRIEEVFELAAQEIRRHGFENRLAAGIVLTGGTARMQGLVESAEKIFQAPARTGCPSGIGGLGEIVSNPAYSTAVGLMFYGRDRLGQASRKRTFENSLGSYWTKTRDWFRDNF